MTKRECNLLVLLAGIGFVAGLLLVRRFVPFDTILGPSSERSIDRIESARTDELFL